MQDVMPQRAAGRGGLAAKAVVALALLSAFSVVGCGGGGTASTLTEEVTSAGGTFPLGDDVVVTIPQGALAKDTTLNVRRASEDHPAPEQSEVAKPLADAYEIDLGGAELLKPVTLEMKFDTEEIPEAEGVPFLAFNDGGEKEWKPVVGTVDQERATIAVETDHLSWWQPSS